jgi:hypothetical protein
LRSNKDHFLATTFLLLLQCVNLTNTIRFIDILRKLDDFQPYFPTVDEDLYGSISAIFLLQDTYNISAHDMANGNIPGKSQILGRH